MLVALTILIAVGLIWTVTGIVMGGSARHGVDTKLMQLVSTLVGSVFLLVLIGCNVYPKISISGAVLWYSLGCYFAVGLIGYVLNETMARAMERGPNGLVWAILQSGMLIPFIVGLYAHDVEPSATRLVGMALLLLSLGLMSMNMNKGSKDMKGKSWLFLSFVAFILCGTQQTINNEPSYSPAVRDGIPVIYRCLVIHLGVMLFASAATLLRGWKSFKLTASRNFSLSWFWIYALGSKVFDIVSILFLTFNGMDRMAKLGCGAISYPVMVVSCIASFTLYTFIVLKERLSWQPLLGLVCCAGGIVLLSL